MSPTLPEMLLLLKKIGYYTQYRHQIFLLFSPGHHHSRRGGLDDDLEVANEGGLLDLLELPDRAVLERRGGDEDVANGERDGERGVEVDPRVVDVGLSPHVPAE